jgi:predicted phage replisome organizer
MATWIKFSTNTFDDEKIKIIENMKEGHTMILFWIKMLSLAGKHETYGEINYTVEELSLLFNFSVIKIEKYLDVFNKFSMISHQNYNEIFINNFMKYQDFEKLRKQKEQTNIRVKRYRENKKDENVTRYNTVTEPLQERYSNADETQQSKNKIEIKKEIKEDDDDNNIIQCIKEGQNPSSSSSKQDLT